MAALLSNFDHPQTTPTDIEPDAVCRICHEGHNEDDPLYHPCLCKGSIRYIHEKCLNTWLQHHKSARCEVCKHAFSYKRIFVSDKPVPSSMNWQSLKDMSSWLCDELIHKNLDIYLRLLFLSTLWLIVCPLLICVLTYFYGEFLHCTLLYNGWQWLQSKLLWWRSTPRLRSYGPSLDAVLTAFCPYHWLQTLARYRALHRYFLLCKIGQGLSLMALSLFICWIQICMKNHGKILKMRPPPDGHPPDHHEDGGPVHEDDVALNVQQNDNDHPAAEHDDEKREAEPHCDVDLESEHDVESTERVRPRRKHAIYHEDDVHSTFCSIDDLKDEEEDGALSDASSTLSELEAKLKVLEQRIANKKGTRHHGEEQLVHDELAEVLLNDLDDAVPVADPLVVPNEPVAAADDIDDVHGVDGVDHDPAVPVDAALDDRFPDNLEGDIAFILDCVGFNDDYEVMVRNHLICLSEMVLTQFLVLLLPHCVGQLTIYMAYSALYTLNMVPYHEYYGQSRYGPMTRNFIALYVGYVSCYLYQKVLSLIMQYAFQSV